MVLPFKVNVAQKSDKNLEYDRTPAAGACLGHKLVVSLRVRRNIAVRFQVVIAKWFVVSNDDKDAQCTVGLTL